MYLLYVDESGDTGLGGTSPTPFFALTGLVLHELRWAQTLEAIIGFRKMLRATYGLKLREEIHAYEFIQRPGDLKRIPRNLRLQILKRCLQFLASLPDINVINVLVDKRNKSAGYDVFEQAWQALVQRFHNTISRKNFPGPQNPEDLGLIVCDRTQEKKLRLLTRRMRRFNPIPSQFGAAPRMVPVDRLVEDAVHRDSQDSYFVQLADVTAFFLYQKHAPGSYVRRRGARNYFDILGPVLCRVAAPRDSQGIVRL